MDARFIYAPVAQPVAQVILFEGGEGHFNGKNPGFLDGSRRLFAEHGFTYVLFEPPSDHPDGLSIGHGARSEYRVSDDQTRDVDSIIAWMRQKSPAPVWLVGISAGTISVGWLGSRVKEPIAGLVFLSTITVGQNRVGTLGLQNVVVPTLIAHHKNDGCKSCPPSGVDVFTALLPPDTRREIVLFEGGANRSFRNREPNPCRPGTFHTFNGIEREVTETIASFVKGRKAP